jgi:hypothetical protein
VLGETLAMVALDLDHPVLEGAARAAEPLHLGGAGLEGGPALRQPADHGDRLAVAAAAVTEETDDTVPRRRGGGTRARLHTPESSRIRARESVYPRGNVDSPARGREGAS